MARKKGIGDWPTAKERDDEDRLRRRLPGYRGPIEAIDLLDEVCGKVLGFLFDPGCSLTKQADAVGLRKKMEDHLVGIRRRILRIKYPGNKLVSDRDRRIGQLVMEGKTDAEIVAQLPKDGFGKVTRDAIRKARTKLPHGTYVGSMAAASDPDAGSDGRVPRVYEPTPRRAGRPKKRNPEK